MPEQERPQIDYYFWLLSDWAYLGGVRLEQMAARHRVPINHLPLKLPDVYARTGGVLLAQRSWQRQAYRVEELKRWRERLGMPCNIEPRFFPADIDLSSCAVIAAQQRGLAIGTLVNALLRAVWADDLDVSDAGVVATILDGHGLDAASLLDAASSECVKAAYAENTDRAVANGVFGSPFYLFDDPINAPFFTPLDWEAVRAGCGAGVACYAGDDDPYVPLRFSREIAERLGAPLRIIPGGKHLNAESGMTAFPELAADLNALLAAPPAARPGAP